MGQAPGLETSPGVRCTLMSGGGGALQFQLLNRSVPLPVLLEKAVPPLTVTIFPKT